MRQESRHRNIISFIALALLCIETMLACSACAADISDINFKKAGKFITALKRDERGRMWIGTEDEGVLVCDPAGDGELRQFTTEDGLGDDNAYALAGDGQGRIWAGNLRHGVSVYNGEKWRNYDVEEGPQGVLRGYAARLEALHGPEPALADRGDEEGIQLRRRTPLRMRTIPGVGIQ